jgi:hypothetical protein
VPTIEMCVIVIFFGWDGILVERLVVRVVQADVFETLILLYLPATDDLHMGLARDGS